MDEAIERLDVIEDYDSGGGPEPSVHTFRFKTMMLGAHWSLDSVRRAFEQYEVVESPEFLRDIGHGLMIVDDVGPVAFATTR